MKVTSGMFGFFSAFDRAHWPTLRNAFRAQRSKHFGSHDIRASKLYESQSGKVRRKSESGRNFSITSGVRQGCGLSPRLFSAVPHWAMIGWSGFHPGDGQLALLDLRFANDILSFVRSYADTVSLLHDLVTVVSQVGLILNANKTVVLTNEA